jgi:regulator of replication initiation timing
LNAILQLKDQEVADLKLVIASMIDENEKLKDQTTNYMAKFGQLTQEVD